MGIYLAMTSGVVVGIIICILVSVLLEENDDL